MSDSSLADVRVTVKLISIFGDKKGISEMHFGLFFMFFMHQFAFTFCDVCNIKPQTVTI